MGEALVVGYSEAFKDSLTGIVDALSGGRVGDASQFMVDELTESEAHQLGEVLNTYDLIQKAKRVDISNTVRVTITGTFAVGKSDLCELLTSKYKIPSVLVEESIEGNLALNDSVNATGKVRSMALFESQLHFLRQVVQETAGAIIELSTKGGGIIVSDQYEAGHRAVREMKVQDDSLTREDCDLLNKLDDLFRSEMPSISTAEVFLIADPQVVRGRLEKRAAADPERRFELKSPVYSEENLSKMQNALLVHAGRLTLSMSGNGSSNGKSSFGAAKQAVPEVFRIDENRIVIDTTELNGRGLVYDVVAWFLFNDRNIRKVLLNGDGE